MLARPYRVKDQNRFRQIYRRGRRASTQLLVIYALANELDHARIGTVISTRVIKQATKRNRQRRRLQALFREVLPRLTAHDLIVVVRADPTPCSYQELRQQLESCFGSVGVLH